MDPIILKSFIPEIFFSLCILLQLIFNIKVINILIFNFPILDKNTFCQTFFIILCLLVLLSNVKIGGFFSNLLFLNDNSTLWVKCILIFFCLSIVGVISQGFILQNLNLFEFYSIFSFSIFSLLLLLSVYDFISSYLAIEIQALSFYILASFKRNSAFSTEAGLKYFISGSFISCIFLFGCSLIYGSLGTLNFHHLTLLLSFPLSEEHTYLNYTVICGSLFIFVTLFFKVAAVPFHFWAPDVYEGAPLSSTIIFSIIPKLSIFNLLIKCINAFSLIYYESQIVFLLVGLSSILFGTFFALKQKRIKRIFIYSSIVQVGFLICALSSNTLSSLTSVYFFLAVYLFSSIILWSFTFYFYSSQQSVNFFDKKGLTFILISNLSTYFKANLTSAVSLMILFFSVAGIPPFCGFLSKFLILLSLVESKNLFFTFLIVIISSISVFYYLRIIKILFFETKNIKSINTDIQTLFSIDLSDLSFNAVSISLFLLIYIFFYPAFLLLLTNFIVLNTFGF